MDDDDDDDDDAMSVSLVEETGVPGGNHRLTARNFLYKPPDLRNYPQQPYGINYGRSKQEAHTNLR